MKYASLIPLAALILAAATPAVQAQARIWRCGNTYTNDAAEAGARNCKVIEGGNITIVEGTRVNTPPAAAAAPVAPAASGAPVARTVARPQPAALGGPRIDSSEQRARDSEARTILEAELKKAEARHAQLLKEYNNGEPEKIGPEHRNYQKYLDRVAELKANLARSENDIASLKRELARLGVSASAASGNGAPAAR